MELPLWMAERLVEAQYAVVELPRNFSAKVREALLAAPESVRLRERSPHFYEVGLRLASLAGHLEEAKTLPAAIQATLATRVSMILTRATNSEGADASRFLESLTDLEQALFWGGYRHTRDRLQWRLGRTGVMRAGGGGGGSGGGGGGAGAGVSVAGAAAAAVAAAVSGGDAPAVQARSIMGGAYKRKRAALA